MYTIELENLKFGGDRKSLFFGKYEFYTGKNSITIRCPDESSNYIRDALRLALSKYEIKGICDDDIQSIFWSESRILFRYYIDNVDDDKRTVKSDNVIDEEFLMMIEPWYKFLKTKSPKIVDSWNFALQEYYSSCTISTLEESILNLITALEALFSVSSSELVYRVSLYTAMYLGDTIENRKKIFELIKQMYDIRSKMVHGDVNVLEKKLKSNNINQQYFELKQIVSTALYKTIGKSKDDVKNEIEEKIFS